MLQNLTGWHAILILVVVLLVFGASKLPALAKSVGQSVKILKDEVADDSAAPRTVDAEPVASERPRSTTGSAAPTQHAAS
ncbi:twin-arginine translocase TatA/TatE family subunit [uncultured Demequina sp.]|uniref:twin-arginine translocase TatA/TatE family subunit n=1 Tax=uncultured Demequina sp. TaxID=693499 RepID=UPI0025F18096|nr:twin-arginine translocase TatA/TatE family subunit [uncultured Demequina sp.]